MTLTTRPRAATALLALVLAGSGPLAFAQSQWTAEWTLDASLEAFSDQQKRLLISGVRKAPREALRAALREDLAALERVYGPEVEARGRAAWDRLLAAREDGHLARAIARELRAAGACTPELLRRVWTAERARLATLPERTVEGTVEGLVKAALIDRARAVRDARLEAARLGRTWGDERPAEFPLNNPTPISSAGETRATFEGLPADSAPELTTDLPLPKVSFFSEKAALERALYEQEFTTELGDLHVTAAKVEGLAKARAGVVEYTNDFGQTVRGLGATFTARAKVTGARGRFESKDMTAAATDLRIRSRVIATGETSAVVEASSTTVVNEHGFGTHNGVRAGAGASATVRVPVVIDLRVIELRVIPYVSAHAGASAEAHATFEVEWSGVVRLDVGAHLSQGIGVGAGIILQLELGDVLQDALDQVVAALSDALRPIADAIVGRAWKGPTVDSEALTISLADLEQLWAADGQVETPGWDASAPAAVAARYAPVLYQQVDQGPFDRLRRVDFDGDWDTANNFEHTTEASDDSAWVYYDVRETASHHYVTYVLYHSGRESRSGNALVRALRRQENTLGGVTVVARKGAARGREVEAIMTHDGDETRLLSGLEPAAGRRTRWGAGHGRWRGEVRFVDEVDHPLFDEERTHPQVWIDGTDHGVHGFTGRDDARPFGGGRGIVYVHTGAAERPASDDDRAVGYALRPLDELLDRRGDAETFAPRRVRAPGARGSLPGFLQGDDGLDDQARLPWAWRHELQEQDPDREDIYRTPGTWVEAGEVFVDPAGVLAKLFRVPPGFGRAYLRNRYAAPALLASPPESAGFTGALSFTGGDATGERDAPAPTPAELTFDGGEPSAPPLSFTGE